MTVNPTEKSDSFPKNKTVAACTLGCKVNAYDTEAMLGLFAAAGYDIVNFPGRADVYVINTCAVTNLAGKKSRQMIRRARAANPGAIVAAVGCYTQLAPEEAGQIDGVNLVLGTKDRNSIVSEVESYARGRGVYRNVSDITGERGFENLSVSKLENRARAFLKIQDGCSRFCAYCVIPYARGPVRSRPQPDVLAEVERLAAAGYKEIVLAGIHVASYGKDLLGEDLLKLLEAVHGVPGIERIRMSSLEPTLIDERFVSALPRLPKICDHFHLSLQSGCDRTLARMNRRYTAARYAEAMALLRGVYPRLAVTTDVIVGFPGETDGDFAESMAFVERMGLSRLHVFPFSPKKGTPAATFEDQVPASVKNERRDAMLRLGERLGRAFIEGMIGKRAVVLFERQAGPGVYEGYTTNYIQVLAPCAENISGRVATVTIDNLSESTAALGTIEKSR